MKRKQLVFPVLIGATVGFFGVPRLKAFRRPSREDIKGEELAEAYDRLAKRPECEALRALLVRELKPYGPSGSLVDIGSGPGYLLMDMARAYPNLKLIGLDTSPDMVALAWRNAQLEGLSDRLEFRVGDVYQLPFEDNSVDFVVSMLSLHRWSTPNSVLQEIHRVLKPGGQMFIFDTRRDPRRVWHWGALFARQCLVPGAIREVDEPVSSILASYTPEEVSAMLEESPFRLRAIESGPVWMRIWARKDW